MGYKVNIQGLTPYFLTPYFSFPPSAVLQKMSSLPEVLSSSTTFFSCGSSGWLGFQLTNQWIDNPNKAMLEELPTIQRLDLYQEVETIEFLEKLRASKMFEDTPEKG